MAEKYYLPSGMRYSTLKERREFYKKEFDFSKTTRWFSKSRNPTETVYAVIIGRHTRLFLKKFSRIAKETILIDDYNNLDDVKSIFLHYLPEAVYYDRNLYSKRCTSCTLSHYQCWRCKHFLGQELAFDIDPENIECPIHGSLESKMRAHQGLGFCETEFEMIKFWTLRLYDELAKRFSQLKVVYSGRGFHIHVFDKKAVKMTKKERRKLSNSLLKKDYPIDEWVTNGNMRLIRMPYSLHAMVSRIAIPVDPNKIGSFNPVTDNRCKPRFL